MPMRLCLLIPALVAVGLLPSWVHAGDVYRWTDADGRVHFGQSPPPGGAERIELPATTPVPDADDGGMAQRRARQQRLLEAYEYERQQKQQRLLAADRQQQRIDEQCRAMRQRLSFLDHAGPIFYRRDDGTREYLDDDQRAAQRRELDAQYQRHCR